MQQVILIFHVLFCISLIVLVLIQHGKGADMGAAFGSGASQSVFGSQGSAPFLFKVTATLGALFFSTSLALTYLTSQIAHQTQSSVLPIPTEVVPATDKNQAIPDIKNLQNNSVPQNQDKTVPAQKK
jgi:preprotein translocase subunit SecG